MLKLDLSYAKLNEEIISYQDQVSEAHKWLHEKTGKGNDFVGWVEWPNTYDKEEFERILKVSEKLKGKFDVLLVCGIGGSYLGARAANEMIRGLYPEEGPEVIFIGNTFSNTYLSQVLKHIEGKDVVLNVISKSGTTTETSVSFRIFKQYIENKYGKEEAKERIIATTDKHKGTLKELADKEGYEEFVVPDDIGGRFSVFTAVGLLPQPFVTTALMKNENLRVALDLNELWESSATDGSRLVTGVVIARNDYLKEHEADIDAFMDAYKDSVEFVNSDTEAAAQIIGNHDIIPAEVAAKAIPECSIVFMEGDEMQTILSGYLNTLNEQNPETIGGQLPDEDFYYKR